MIPTSQPSDAAEQQPGTRTPSTPAPASRLRRLLIGPPRNIEERGVFHKVSLIALLAWVGLGADGLSSSAYGPEEAFRTLGEHQYLAVLLAALMVTTVLVISAGYSRIIELFPHGGGGYVVASKLLGQKAGVLSGCALLIDYVLTIAISIAAAGDALFSLLPPEWHAWKLPTAFALVAAMTLLNLRGVRESVMVLAPVFFLFVITHTILIAGGFLRHVPEISQTATNVTQGFSSGYATLGLSGLTLLLLQAFSLGGGTYTGIEAVSNGVPIMRHPQVATAKRTMLYMAISLAFTATGLLLCYLLWRIVPQTGKTMNAVLVEEVSRGIPGASIFVILTMVSAGALLVVAAQAGFTDGPRVLANMAMDSWAPRRFAALSDRLTTQNGIALMGLTAVGALLYTRGDVRHLVVMYSINVFLTFSLSLGGMLLHSFRERRARRPWRKDAALFSVGFGLAAVILGVTIYEKFGSGGWITLAATGALVILCMLIRRHYQSVSRELSRAFKAFESPAISNAPLASRDSSSIRDPRAAIDDFPQSAIQNPQSKITPASPLAPCPSPLNPRLPTAAILVTSYGGIGIHTTLNTFRVFPGHFKNVVFLSVGVIDSGAFKGEGSVEQLKQQTAAMLDQYVSFAHRLGIPATTRMGIGTDAVEEAEKLCLATAREFPHATFIAGQIIFQRDTWYRRLLHNQTAYTIQRRLQWAGQNMVILPARVQDL